MNDDELIAEWLKGKAPRTASAYLLDVETFRAYSKRRLSEVEAADLLRFTSAVERAGGKPSTVRRKVRAVKSLLSFGHAIGALPRHAGLTVRVPGGDAAAPAVPSRSEVLRAIRLTRDARDALLLQTLYVAGLRASEAAELRGRDVRPDTDAIPAIAVFGPRRRVVRIPAALFDALRDRLEGNRGFNLSARQVARIVKERAIAAGLPENTTAERLRAAHRAHALYRGAPIAVICATLGDRLPIAAPEMLADRAADSSAFYLL